MANCSTRTPKFGDGVMAELVNQDHESEHDPHDENAVKK